MTGDTAGTPRKRAARPKAATATKSATAPTAKRRSTRPKTSPAPVESAPVDAARSSAVLPEQVWESATEAQPPPDFRPAWTAEPEPAPEPDETPAPAAVSARLAIADELAAWDQRTVFTPNGHVFQSRAWADYRGAHGWLPRYLAFDDGFRMLVLAPPGSNGGGMAYASRGPIPEGDPRLTAMRVAEAGRLLKAEGAAALTVDGETPAASGLDRLLRAEGFDRTDELQPSRHRMDVRLGPDDAPNSDDKTIFSSFGATTRNLIRQAERHDIRVKRLDAGGGRADDEPGTGLLEDFEAVDLDEGETVDRLLRTFYEMLETTAERRGFALAPEDRFLDWSIRALHAGYLLYLQAEHAEDGPVAGATFYRHGHRLTYSLAGDRAELRRKYPGAVRLLVWRGIQIALDERRTTVDLGGVDTDGARDRPSKGDPNFGMYQFKESFGARWVELTGAHERTFRPMQRLAGRLLSKLAALRR